MQSVVAFEQTHGNNVYVLSLEFDDESLAEGVFSVGCRVKKSRREAPHEDKSVIARATVFKDDNDVLMLRVSFSGESQEGSVQTDTWSKPLSEIFGAEQIVDTIPAWLFGGDLIVGCMLRSGLSAVIGRLLACKNKTAEELRRLERIRAIYECITRSVPDIALTAARRAAKCVWRFGF